MWEFLKIWCLAILAAVAYGLVQDQVTIRVCPEYFTVFHPPLIPTDSLTLLALQWGVVATWWMGAILGLPLALAARVGRVPALSARQMVRPLGVLLAVMAVSALIAGIAGYHHGDPLAGQYVPPAQFAAFSADLWAHNTAYFIGAWGALVLCAWIIARRRRAL